MVDKSDREAEWRAEFERDGERKVYDSIKIANYQDERKRRAAFHWLTTEATRRRAHVFRAMEVATWMLISVFAVIIVGAGVAGLSAAAKLARSGVSVTIIEARS